MTSAPETPRVTIHAQRLARGALLALLGIELLLLALDALAAYTRFFRYPALAALFQITSEEGLGNWFSSMQTLLVAGLLALIALRLRRQPGARWRAVGWAALALFFLYLAVDDGAAVHERIGSYADFLRKSGAGAPVLGWLSRHFSTTYTWQLIFGPFFGAAGLFLLVFLWRELEQRTTRVLLLLALLCYVVAVGLDYVEGTRTGYIGIMRAFSINFDTATHLARSVEELLEMFGTTLFVVTFLLHLARLSPALELRFVLDDEERERAS